MNWRNRVCTHKRAEIVCESESAIRASGPWIERFRVGLRASSLVPSSHSGVARALEGSR
jgi:hypothetical protein